MAQLDLHDIRAIAIAKNAAPAALLHLLRTLATPLGGFPAGGDAAAALRLAGVGDIEIVVQPPPSPIPQPAPVPRPPPEPEPPQVSGPEAAVADIARAPRTAEFADRLAAAADEIREECREGRLSGAVRALAQLVNVAETTSAGLEAVTLWETVHALLTPEVFAAAVECARTEESRSAAHRVLRAGRAAATEFLRERLLAAASPEDRRHHVALLRQQPEGLRYFFLLLQHPEPDMAIRTADLIGELELREAVPLLERVVVHPEPRVRDAVLRALVCIATPEAVTLLGQLLREPAGELRTAAARAIGGAGLGAIVPVIDEVAAIERDTGMLTELGRALGRVGTPEAVTLLTRWAQPPGLRFWRSGTARRLAAVAGLQLAGGAGAVGVLWGLTTDRDSAVRRAAAEVPKGSSIAARTRRP
jgi:hypothetical protein